MSSTSDWPQPEQQNSLNPASQDHSMVSLEWSVISIEGKDAKSFLQGQVTLNVDALNAGTLAYGGYCNLKGRLHALFYLANMQDSYWMILPSSNATHALATLKKYAMFSKATLTLKHDSCIGLINPADETFKTDAFCAKKVTVGDSCLTCIGLSQQRVMVFADENTLSDTWKTLEPSHPLTSTAYWDACDIRDGRAFLSSETLEFFLPHYIGLVEWGGVDFSKGCYLGQEIIARMQYRGNIKRHRMFGKTQATSLPMAGTAVLINGTDKEVGHVISAAQHDDAIELLLTLQEEAKEQNLQLNLPEKPALTGVLAYSN